MRMSRFGLVTPPLLPLLRSLALRSPADLYGGSIKDAPSW